MLRIALALIVLALGSLLAYSSVNHETEPSENVAVEDARGGRSLDLSNQGLTTVPGSVFEQRTLVNLDISQNALTGALQAEIRHLSNLVMLDMSDNGFTGVPAEVGQLQKLEVLDLSYNQLTGLPHEIANLKNLKTLDLRGNVPAAYDLTIIRQGLPNTSILVD